MLGFVLKRLAAAIPTVLAVLTIIFFFARILPGDPALVILGDAASAEAIEHLRQRLGLDRPLYEQYVDFLLLTLQGDLGRSLFTERPVLVEIWSVLPYTIDLTVASLVVGTGLGVPIGVLSALRRNTTLDYVVRIISLLGISFPPFFLGILALLIFAIGLKAFPVISAGDLSNIAERLHYLVLPAATLGIIVTAYVSRAARSAMLEVLPEDYIRTARAKGLPPAVLILRHALRNALIPVVTVIGLYAGILIGNAAVTEIVFTRPGLGKLIVGALNTRDYVMLQGLIVAYSLIVIFINLVTDLAYGLINPRVRHQ